MARLDDDIDRMSDEEREEAFDFGKAFAALHAGKVISDADEFKGEPDIFVLDPVEFFFQGQLLDMAVSNSILIMALSTNRILRINLQQAHEVEDMEVTKKSDDRIHRIFFDPSGTHLLISMTNGDNYYHYAKWKKPKLLTKMKGMVIESVAWNRNKNNSISTKEILIGTLNGAIYETEIEPTDEYFKREEKYLKQLQALGNSQPITGLWVEPFPTGGRKVLILVTTTTRIYQFVGATSGSAGSDSASVFEGLFAHYDANSGFQELPGELSHSELHLFSQYQGVAKSFAWLTGPGIYQGNLVFGSQNVGDAVIDGAQLLPYPPLDMDVGIDAPPTFLHEHGKPPLSIAVTEFHFLLAYEDRLRAVNRLNEEVVYEQPLPPRSGKLVALAVDRIKGTFWAFTEKCMFEILITHEDRNIWEVYLEKKQFDTALSFAKTPAQRDQVLTTQAEHYFSQGRYILSASYFAQTTIPFESVALRFINLSEREALKTFLINKLERLGADDKTQITLISTWLVEIFLNRLNVLHAEEKLDEEKALQEEFQQFITSNNVKKCLDKNTTFKLITSLGRTEELLYFANIIQDYERVISYFIQIRDFKKGLEAICKQLNHDLYYKFATVLMEQIPYEFVSALMRENKLQPRLLLPALMKYNPARNPPSVSQNQVIRYLQHAVYIQGNTDPAVHNYLLSLYVSGTDDNALMSFLNAETRHTYYDPQYALRLCSQLGKTQACIHIYSQLGLYEEAVDLALKHKDLVLAKINADKPEESGLRKKLWLKIAKKVVLEEKNIRKAMEFLKECDLLKIDDILPFFPDFVLIDDFKEEICAALEEYNEHISNLKTEMDEATRSAEAIRVDIRELRNKYAFIRSSEKCYVCEFPLLTRGFYLFPCQHAFHADCLLSEAGKFASDATRARINELRMKSESSTALRPAARDLSLDAIPAVSLAANVINKAAATVTTAVASAATNIVNGEAGMSGANGQGGANANSAGGMVGGTAAGAAGATGANMDLTISASTRDGPERNVQNQIEDVIAAECLLCGDAMIRSIQRPFIDPLETDTARSWAI